MFREMRRASRATTRDEAIAIIRTQNYGVLSVVGEDGYPYGVPLNYAWLDGKVYFHSAPEGAKLDAIRRDPRVCFTVTSRAELLPGELSTDYASAILFGRARIVEDAEERKSLVIRMTRALSEEAYAALMRRSCVDAARYVVVEITPEHITGKARAKQEKLL